VIGPVIAEVLPFAVALAMVPTPVIKMVRMLLSGQARTNGIAYITGRALGFLVAVAIVLVLGGAVHLATHRTASLVAAVIKLLLGVLLILAAAWLWRDRSDPDDEPQPPGWMRRTSASRPISTFAVSFLIAGADPRNLPSTIGAGLDIAQAGLPVGRSAIVLAVFVVVGTATVVLPLFVYLASGPAVQRKLDPFKAWLVANNQTVLTVVFLLLGVVLIGKGIRGIIA